MTRWGATEEEWAHFSGTLRLREHLLPVVSNPNAKISPKSAIKSPGKIPTLYNSEGNIVGISKWTEHKTSLEEIKKWMKQPDYGICIQCHYIRALDCDIESPELADKIIKFLIKKGINWPARGRENSSKFLLAFRIEGNFNKRTMLLKDGLPGDKIEFLANGQQFIACGTHPKGDKYEWIGSLPEEIPLVDVQAFERLWKELVTLFGVDISGADNSTEYQPRKAASLGNRYRTDDTLSYLESKGNILEYNNEGAAYISCPFKANHSREGDKTETIYFPAGSRGYAQGHFNCLHASCSGRSDEEFLDALGARSGMFEDLGPLAADPANREKFKVMSLQEFMQRPPTRWLIKGILPAEALVMAFGGSGDGKTFAAIDMCMAVARGIEWNGHKIKAGKVVYVCAESQGDFVNRLNAYCTHHKVDMAEIAGSFGVIADTPNFRIENDAKLLAQRILEWGATDLIVIDTLAQTTAGADENSSQDMGMALKCSELIRRTVGGTVKLVHHAGKDEDRGARGWSGLKAPMEAQFQISREDDTRTFWVAKEKGARDNYGWSFNLIPVPLGLDEDGDIIESLVVQWAGRVSTKKKTKQKQRGTNEQAVIKAFDELGGASCSVSDLIAKALEFIPKDPEKRDQRRRDIMRAIASLDTDGVFKASEEKVEIQL